MNIIIYRLLAIFHPINTQPIATKNLNVEESSIKPPFLALIFKTGNIVKSIPIATTIPIKGESLLILNTSHNTVINTNVIKVVNILQPHLNKYCLRYLLSINLYV